MKIYASRSSASNLTIGEFYDLIVSQDISLVTIYDVKDSKYGNRYIPIFEGKFKDAFRAYPELKNARIIAFDVISNYEFSIRTFADFDYERAY